MIKDITAKDLKEWLNSQTDNLPFVLDVRNNDELEKAKLAGAYHIPMHDIADRIDEIPRDRPVVCMCHHGMRSAKVAYALMNKGFNNIYNVEGGIHAMSSVDENIAKY
jgi:rhodanese-related sulfurtransferase